MSRRPRAGLGLLVSALALLLAGPAVAGAGPAVAGPPPPHLPVTGACLMVAGTSQILDQVNGGAELPIASTTKLMTALITLEHVHRLSEVLTQNDWYPASVDSQIGLVPGERMSVHDLLLALLIPSGDDAAEDLAYNLGGGSVGRFVAMMNAQAQALGLTRTHYSNPIGLDQTGNYSSACDLDRLAAYDLETSAYFRRVVALPSATLWSGRYVRHVVNTDDLVGRIPWVLGVKTGHTADAGYVLVSEGRRNGMTLIGSVLGTPTQAARDASALALLDYGYGAFHAITVLRPGQVVARPAIRGFARRRAVVVATGSFHGIEAVTARIRVVLNVPRRLTGPLPAHLPIGYATVLVGKRPASEVPLELAARVPRPPAASALVALGRVVLRPFTLIPLALALVIGGALTGRRRRRPRALAAGGLEEG